MAMRNKALAGGAIGLVLVGAYYLGNLFNGFGLGPGGGPGSGTGNGDGDSETVNSAEEPDLDNTKPVSKAEPPGVELGKIVMVLIDGEEYKVLRSPEADVLEAANYRPATLEQIVQMAKDVEGVQGLKVRIAMRPNSTADAEDRLHNALREAGLQSAFRDLKETIP
jgi:hypothetical protein